MKWNKKSILQSVILSYYYYYYFIRFFFSVKKHPVKKSYTTVSQTILNRSHILFGGLAGKRATVISEEL